MRNLKLLTILFVLVLSVAFSGCTHKNNENTTTEIVEETTTEPIDYNNPLGIEGYTYYGRDNVVNGKDVVLAAKIEVEATLNDKKLDDIILYKCSDDKVVAEIQRRPFPSQFQW